MTRTVKGMYAYARRVGLLLLMGGFFAGTFVGWLAMAWNPREGIQIVQMGEAEGAQFADPTVLSIAFQRRPAPGCSLTAQDFIWHWVDYLGRRVKDRRQLDNALVPFMDGDDLAIVSMPVPRDIDITSGWFYRRSFHEECTVLPSWVTPWLSRWFMTVREFHTDDKPVNFVGEPHAARK